jgi:NAD(P)-dependent dehydrogenase (short-subunit alcohol dehydrogenase family)
MSKHWTTNDIPDLTGKVVIVTGANSGIGYEAALELARKGAHTILACRSMDKAQTALSQIHVQVPNARAEIMQLDLASQASIHAFAAAFKARYERLDVLINNAGIMMVPYGKTEDGFERQFGTNHLGHFALTGLLMDRILATPGARVVNISSGAHRMGNIDFDNLMYESGKGYTPAQAYGRSKLANLLFTYELQRRFNAIGADTKAIAAHPGGSNTNLANHMEDHALFRLVRPLLAIIMQPAAMGALPTLRATVDPQAAGGVYFGPDGFREMRGDPVIVEASAAAHDVTAANKLWSVSQELTGVKMAQLDGVAL